MAQLIKVDDQYQMPISVSVALIVIFVNYYAVHFVDNVCLKWLDTCCI